MGAEAKFTIKSSFHHDDEEATGTKPKQTLTVLPSRVLFVDVSIDMNIKMNMNLTHVREEFVQSLSINLWREMIVSNLCIGLDSICQNVTSCQNVFYSG